MSSSHDYRGFVAGVGSGVAKLTVGHPFDTVKVRLQSSTRFRGALDCVARTVRLEGVAGLYKGATPPLVGWMLMDSVMLGSLSVYRRLLAQHVFRVDVWAPGTLLPSSSSSSSPKPTTTTTTTTAAPATALSSFGHGIAGIAAGCTVSFVATPFEHVKARLQIQYAARKADRRYSGPVDCLVRVWRHHGLAGVYRGLAATLLFRSFFCVWWGSYDALSRALRRNRPGLADAAVNFAAGGLSAQLFWVAAYPADLVKQRIMTDPLGGSLGDGCRKYPRWRDAALDVYRQAGLRGYWRGFLPCFLRAFPANAIALVVFEGLMRSLP